MGGGGVGSPQSCSKLAQKQCFPGENGVFLGETRCFGQTISDIRQIWQGCNSEQVSQYQYIYYYLIFTK